jgi:hypothetical protein
MLLGFLTVTVWVWISIPKLCIYRYGAAKDIIELGVNNNKNIYRHCGRVKMILAKVKSTLQVLGNIYCSPWMVLSELYKLAVNKLVSPSVGKVR